MKTLINMLEGSIGKDNYLCSISWRNGTLLMDEPETIGGKDRGPDPYTTLLAALAGCTLSTLRMYIDRKDWNISQITVNLSMEQSTEGPIVTSIKREISFPDLVEDDIKQRLLVIAKKCPVSKILENKIELSTLI